MSANSLHQTVAGHSEAGQTAANLAQAARFPRRRGPKPWLQFFAFAFVGILAGCSAAAAEQPAPSREKSSPTAAEIDAWVAQLDDDRYLVREQATRQLLESGPAALDPLLQTANAGRPEPADRAVWVLRRLGRSPDNDLAIAALERLIEIQSRPVLVEKAEIELAERSIVACQQRLAPLGADVSVQMEQIDLTTVAPLLQLRLGPQWQGTLDDLRLVAELRHQQCFRLQGVPVDDAIVKLFEERKQLEFLQLHDTKVTPAAVDAIKERHPDATVYMRNEALLGISAEREKQANGVMVQDVRPRTAAAAAGIVAGDVIAAIDGHALPDFDRLTVRIAQHRPGETIDVEILRGGERKTLSVTLGSWAELGGG